MKTNIRKDEPNRILLLCFLTNADAYQTIKRIATTNYGVLSEVEFYFLIFFCFWFVNWKSLSFYLLLQIVFGHDLNIEKALDVIEEIKAKLGAEPWRLGSSFESLRSMVLSYNSIGHVRAFVASTESNLSRFCSSFQIGDLSRSSFRKSVRGALK